MQKLLLVISLVVHTVSSLNKCQDDYILRQIWTNRHQSKNICCKKVTENCKPGYYLKTCTGRSNLSRDVCNHCPGNTWLADETNSTYVHECVDYSCLIGAKRVDYLPKSGCHMPCVCETERNFYGTDSCKCKLFQGTCPANTKLALNGSCLSYRDAEKMNDLKPKDGSVDIPIEVIKKINGTKDNSSRNPDNSWLADKDVEKKNDFKPKDGSVDIPDEVIKKINGTKDDSSRNLDNSWLADKWIITGPILVVIVFTGILSIFSVVVIRHRTCKKDTHNEENPAKPTESVYDVSVSGLSDTSSSELDEINHEQQTHVNKIDHKHTSDQTEKKIDIKCVSDQRDDKTNEPCQQTTCEPCQQTTLVEINKQDQIVKPHIKDEVKVLCYTNASENVSKYSPRRETSKYSSQKETEKQVAKITPFRSEDDMIAKVTDPLLGSSDGGGGYPEDQIQFRRPPHINDLHLNEDNTHTELIPMDYDFGSSLRMSSSLDNISDT